MFFIEAVLHVAFTTFRQHPPLPTNENSATRLSWPDELRAVENPSSSIFPDRNAFFSLHSETNHLYDPLNEAAQPLRLRWGIVQR